MYAKFPQTLCAVLLTMSAMSAHSSTEVRVKSLAFDVLLNDEPIGRHEFTIRENDSSRVVESRAEFDVRVLFVPVFRYRHSNTEQWADGCLRRIESVTDSNGKAYRVNGEERGDGFAIETKEAQRAYDGDCVMTFAYWDRRFLEQDKLLNSQTGELVDVDVSPLPESRIELDGESVEVEAYRILSNDATVDIRVYYARGSDEWVALESLLENGRLMRYRPLHRQVAGAATLTAR